MQKKKGLKIDEFKTHHVSTLLRWLDLVILIMQAELMIRSPFMVISF